MNDPWASFLPKGWGPPPKGSGKSEAARPAAPLVPPRKASAHKGKGKGGTPAAWNRKLSPKAAEGKGTLVNQPQWEKGFLMEDEWNVQVISQEELLEKEGVALASRQFLLDHADTLESNGSPAAAIIPLGKQWFENKPRTEALTRLLNSSHEISFTYSFLEDGIPRSRPKDGLLVQLSLHQDVYQKTGVIRNFDSERLDEITLEFHQDAMPPRKWEEVVKDAKRFFEKVVMDVAGDDTLMLRTTRVRDKGDSMSTTVKVPPTLTATVLTNVDKHHIFARMTVRDEEKDCVNEPIWMANDNGLPFLAYIRQLREVGMRNAGGVHTVVFV